MSLFTLPDLGEGLPDAQIHQWFVKEGDAVEVDQPLVSMETAKAIVDVPSPVKAVIKKLYGQVGDLIQTGAPLIEFEQVDAASSMPPVKSHDKGTVVGNLEQRSGTLVEHFASGSTAATTGSWMNATFAVRTLAKKLGVDLRTMASTSNSGFITAEEVIRASQAVVSHDHASVVNGEPLRGVRRVMAQVMQASHQSVVPVSIFDDADITHWAPDTDITVRIIQAMCQAIAKEPLINAWFDGEALTLEVKKSIDLGLAVDTAEGLFVPVIKNAGSMNASALRQSINACKQGVQSRTLEPAQLHGATITLSNFGTFAGRYASPIIVPPTVAILAVGAIADAVLVKNKHAVVSRVLPLSLSFDHRALTGGEASRFLGEMIKALSA